jgi:hypothetical protein
MNTWVQKNKNTAVEKKTRPTPQLHKCHNQLIYVAVKKWSFDTGLYKIKLVFSGYAVYTISAWKYDILFNNIQKKLLLHSFIHSWL